jgi:hypothetical protein
MVLGLLHSTVAVMLLVGPGAQHQTTFCKMPRPAFRGYFSTRHRKRSRIYVSSSASVVSERLGLDDRFGRWRYLQELLDEESSEDDTNKILYHVLDGYLKFPRPTFEETVATGSPELTPERRAAIEDLLSSAENGSIPALIDDSGEMSANGLVFKQLEKVLPDPSEDEDGMKGAWDIVLALHGIEGVKFNEQNPTPEWKARCLTARVLLYHDFLIYGLVDRPIS